MSLLIKNCKLVLNSNIVEKNILIVDGKIEKISENELGADETIDAKDNYVLAGAIDVHVHCREPGDEYKEDFESASRAAAKGGITTILDMPNNKVPITTVKLLEEKRELAKKSIVNYGFIFGATEKNIDEIEKSDNIAAVKVFMGSSTGDLLVTNQDALEKIFSLKKLIAVHAEDEETINENSKKFEKHTQIRSKEAALIATKKALKLALEKETKLHFCHVSTKDEIEAIRNSNTDVSCEVTPHHLLLDERYMEKLGNFAKMNPPLRTNDDIQALWEGINDGTVKMIADDHAPHTIEDKEKGQAPSGVPGLETTIPLMLNALNENKINFETLTNIISKNPATRFGIEKKGRIKEGYDADLIIVDLNEEYTIKNSELVTKCNWSPFDGFKIKGKIITTIVNGNVVYNNGEFNDIKAKEVIIND